MFIGREKELAELEKAYSDDGFQLILVYGPKASGKTTLIEEFCRNKSAVYFAANQSSNRANMARFSSKVLQFFADKSHEPFRFWDSALGYIAKAYRNNRIIVVIEGFEFLAENDAAFMNVFSRTIDTILHDSGMMLILSCERTKIFAHTSLLGRINGAIRLGKFLTDENIARLRENEQRKSGMANQAKFVRVPADRVILREGTRNNEMYKIISGRAILSLNYGTDDEYMLGSLKEGKTFGEYSLLTGKPGIYTVTAFTDMLLMRIGRGEFMKFLELNAGNSVNIMQNMAAMMNMMKVNIDMLNDELHNTV